jgi:hypothetical protein
MNINGKTIAAYILLLIDVAFFFWAGHMVAENQAAHHAAFPQIPEGMHLTFSKDVDLKEYSDDTVHISSGTVITLCEMHFDKIHFYYSENKENFEIFKRLDSLDRLSRSKELGVMYLHADFDCFAEQKQLEQIYDKAINEARSKQREVFWENFTPVIPLGLCIFVVGFFFTRLLIKKQWYVLLYVVDIVGMGVIFFGLPFFLCH